MRPILLLCLVAVTALAQRGTVDVRGTAGYTTFIDESPQGHLFTGGSVRYYLLDRLSIEPEFLFLYKDKTDKDLGFQVNAAWNFGRRRSRVVPYVIGGGGVLHSIFRFSGGPGGFGVTEGMWSAGGGAKLYFNERWFIAPEMRIGLEPVVRATVSIGYSWR